MNSKVVKEYKHNSIHFYDKPGKEYLETSDGRAWTQTQNGVFWIETCGGGPTDFVYNAMVKLGRELLGCRYLYD